MSSGGPVPRSRRAIGVAAALVLLGTPALVIAAGLPTRLRAHLVWRVLSYDTTLGDTTLGALAVEPMRILVLGSEDDGSSVELVGQLRLLADSQPLAGRRWVIEHVLVSAANQASLVASADKTTAQVWVIDLDREHAWRIGVALASAADVVTITFDERVVRAGATVAIVEQELRPTLFVNLSSARRAGAHFEASFLRLATVVGDSP